MARKTTLKAKAAAGINLDELSDTQLSSLKNNIEAALKMRAHGKLDSLAEDTMKKVMAMGMTMQDLIDRTTSPTTAKVKGEKPKKPSAKSTGKRNLPVKFKSPEGETWTGVGRPPRWMASLEAEGKSREEYKV